MVIHTLWVGLAKAYLRLAPAFPSPDYLPLDQLTLESGLGRAQEEFNDELTSGFLKLFENRPLPLGKTLLDLGCGFGGRTVAFQQKIQGTTIGIEIDQRIVDCAREFARRKETTSVSFVAGVGESLPFESASLDAIFCYDVFEHVQNPQQCLAECFRVLKPGGEFWLVFPPYHHPTGAHLEGYVSHMPYASVLFSASTLLQAIDEILASRKGTFQPLALYPGHILYSLNGLTIRSFRAMLQQSGFEVDTFTCLPLFTKANRRYHAWKMKYYGWFFVWLATIPFIQEMFTHRVVAVLRKPR
ncbi:MAG: class I SAM-dependent methyltransferase [Acidobacteria bacterium]|nr:class I SAM-dependent methyltransferase [Acidobacteriota bacterium]